MKEMEVKKRDVYFSKTISNIDNSFILSVGYDRHKDEHYMLTIQFTDQHSYGPSYWDNDRYIFDIFYPMLKRYVERTLTTEDNNEFEDFLTKVDEDDVLEIIDILEEAIDIGWNKLKI